MTIKFSVVIKGKKYSGDLIFICGFAVFWALRIVEEREKCKIFHIWNLALAVLFARLYNLFCSAFHGSTALYLGIAAFAPALVNSLRLPVRSCRSQA